MTDMYFSNNDYTPQGNGNLPGKSGRRFTKKQKAQHFAAKSRKGALSNSGVPLSDFQRGRNFGRAEQINQDRGDYAWRNSDTAGRAEIQRKREKFQQNQERKRAKYFAKLQQKEQRKAARQAAKGGKK